MKPNTFNTTSALPNLFLHDYSRTITKVKPKIRIVHIVAPEIIKTDVQNFRELVQRLTGKPAEKKQSTNKGNSTSSLLPKPYSSKPTVMKNSESDQVIQDYTQRMNIKTADHQDIYGGDNPNAFLSFYGDVDGFINPYMNEFPLRSNQITAFGEMNFC